MGAAIVILALLLVITIVAIGILGTEAHRLCDLEHLLRRERDNLLASLDATQREADVLKARLEDTHKEISTLREFRLRILEVVGGQNPPEPSKGGRVMINPLVGQDTWSANYGK